MFFYGLVLGFVVYGLAIGVVALLGRVFGIWRFVPERTILVYTLFGKVVGQVDDAGVFFPVVRFGPKAVLLPIFGKAYKVSNALQQNYLRNQLVNSDEGAPMGVGVWYEMLVSDVAGFLFKNADPQGSLAANVATAVSKQLSNLKLQTLLEDRDALSKKVREEVSPTSSQWGYQLGSTYIRKVAFRDQAMIEGIEKKVVNRLRQVTAGMRQAGDNQVALIQSDAEKTAAAKLGEAQAVRPQVIGKILNEIQQVPEVGEALFRLLEIQATLASQSKITVVPSSGITLLLPTA